MRNLGLAIAVFAMSFTLSSIAFVQTNKTNNTKPTQQTKQTASKKQEVRCPVTGKVITDTKKAPKLTYQGKTYYFSCQNCLAEFRKNPQKYIQTTSNIRTVSNTPAKKEGACCSSDAKAEGTACCAGDKATAQKQGSCCADKQPTVQTAAAPAPADKLICPVSGEDLEEASAIRFTYNGKVYYTCCNGCKSKFLKDPETFAKKAEEMSKLQGKPETKTQ